jgi:DNA-binding response OmpR family regulator
MSASWSLKQMFARPFDRSHGQGLADAEEAPGGIIESGDFRIDLTLRTAILRGRELRLTGEEFDVLVFLSGHPQSLVTPHTMLATSSGAKRDRRTGLLKALISLGKKLNAEAGPHQHYLQTEPWVVYRFDPVSSSAP